jgi:DNA invertase Pin-like site-specific DNA recombinase
LAARLRCPAPTSEMVGEAMKHPMRIIAYSCEPAESSYGALTDDPGAQLQKIHSVARQRGWKIVQVVQDSAPERPQLYLQLARLNRGEADVLAVAHVASLVDRRAQLRRLHELSAKYSWILCPVGIGIPLGRLVPFGLDELLSHLHRESVRRGIAKRRADGKPFGRPPRS